MIIVKNSQLNNETVSILNKLIEMDIKAGAAFKLMRIIKDLSIIVEDKLKFEKRILNKWAQKDENGNFYPALDENGNIIEGSVKIIDVVKFEEEVLELMSIENNIPHNKVKFEEMGLNDPLKIKDLLKIEFIFE